LCHIKLEMLLIFSFTRVDYVHVLLLLLLLLLLILSSS